MKKRIISAVLALLMLLCLMPLALADGGAFTDVPETAYYFDAVNEMAADGVVNGRGGGIFAPTDMVKKLEAIAMLARTIKVEGVASFSYPTDYVVWAISNGLFDETTDYYAAASREDVAEYITRVLGLELKSSDGGFRDTDSPYAYTMREFGVVVGYDDPVTGERIFGGKDNVKRCDLCLMLSRLKHSFDAYLWLPEELFDHMGDWISEAPETEEEIAETVRFMMRNGRSETTFSYTGLSLTKAEIEAKIKWIYSAAQKAYSEVAGEWAEYGYFYGGMGYNAGYRYYGDTYTELTLTFSLTKRGDMSDEELQERIVAADYWYRDTVRSLYYSGDLRTDMTDREKAAVLYALVDGLLEYDLSYGGADVYTVLRDRKAVCEGYTAVFNGLCHVAGIKMLTQTGTCGERGVVPGGGHAWSKLLVDGEVIHVDATWGDQKSGVDWSWFWIDWATLSALDNDRQMRT